jgi:hypothetical protein
MSTPTTHRGAITTTNRQHREYLEAELAEASRRGDAAAAARLTRRLERWITHVEPSVSAQLRALRRSES